MNDLFGLQSGAQWSEYVLFSMHRQKLQGGLLLYGPGNLSPVKDDRS